MFRELQEGPVWLQQSRSEGGGFGPGTEGGRSVDNIAPCRTPIKILFFSEWERVITKF